VDASIINMNTDTLIVRSPSLKINKYFKDLLVNLCLIISGSIVFVWGMHAVMLPAKLYGGGLTGIAILLNIHLPSIDVGLSYFILNIPLILLGWAHLGKGFIAYTLFGIIFFSIAAIGIRPAPITIEDPILATLLAGVICGTGNGLILRSLGSAGGLDILAIYLNKRFGYRVGTVSSVFSILVVIAGAYLLNVDLALYSIIYLFVCGRVTNMVITGFNARKSVLIISNYADRIANDILHKVGRGVTYLDGAGAYSRNKKKIILTITTLTDIPKLKKLVFVHDPEAFIVINDTLEVINKKSAAHLQLR
jgi:uncharacterized membrane-anchored protein YitT (DUF2179 family)